MYDELRHRFDGRPSLARKSLDLVNASATSGRGKRSFGSSHQDRHDKLFYTANGSCARPRRAADVRCGHSSQSYAAVAARGRTRLTHEDDGTVPTGACVFILYLDGRTGQVAPGAPQRRAPPAARVAREREMKPLYFCCTSTTPRWHNPIPFERFYDPDRRHWSSQGGAVQCRCHPARP